MANVYCQKYKCSFNRNQMCSTSAISLIRLNGGKLRCGAYTDRVLHPDTFIGGEKNNTIKRVKEEAEKE